MINPKSKEDFAKMLKILHLALNYNANAELNSMVIELYWQKFGVTTPHWHKVLDNAISTLDRWPTIAKLNELAGNPKGIENASPNELAFELSGQAISAITKWGYCNEEKAKADLGPIIWNAITTMSGSWTNFCDIPETDQLGMIRAQLRGVIQSQISREGIDKKLLPLNMLPIDQHQKAVESQNLEYKKQTYNKFVISKVLASCGLDPSNFDATKHLKLISEKD